MQMLKSDLSNLAYSVISGIRPDPITILRIEFKYTSLRFERALKCL